ncbi:WXG100 family type VII secretion target [Aciditerrimonas ferrireducens]|uniref:WXG100 family type VII secretion target n=1 Tax=Aciditerrimonas ferrireducens TaxID=667306 RepID=A0ABV6C1Z0_9ACTN
MANSGYQVSPEQLELAATQVERGAAKVKAAVEDVLRIIEGVSAQWSGTAQKQFAALCSSWAANASELDRSILTIATLLKNAAAAYEQAEAQVARLFGQPESSAASRAEANGPEAPTAPVPPTPAPFQGIGLRPRAEALGPADGEG